MRELLRMEGVSVGESGQMALSDFDLVLNQGEILGVFSVHATVKNRLVGVISGALSAQGGRLYVESEPCPYGENNSIRQRKVGVIHSVKSLVDDLSVAENIFVIRRGFKSGVIDERLLNTQTQQLMEEFGLAIEPRALIRNLGEVERCSLEVVKAIALGACIVVFKDLSSFLPDASIAQLLGFAEGLKNKGVGFLMVDSSVSHLANYADRVMVVGNGRSLWCFKRGEINEEVLKFCYSREQAAAMPEQPAAVGDGSGQVAALAFEAVAAEHLEALSFTLLPGEELCIVDPEGKGIEAIRALLGGEKRPTRGRIRVDGEPFTARNAWAALDQRVAFIVENPADAMLFPDLTTLENLCLPAGRKIPGFWRNPVYLESSRDEYSEFFSPGALAKYPDQLSAQDLHKLVYCRWHLYKPAVVVCIKPFSSVDKSLEEISAFFIRLLRSKGIAVLILTSNALETDIHCKKILINQKNAPLHPKNDL